VISPGPPSLEPGAAPGGVVIHVYAVPSGLLLAVSTNATPTQAAYAAGLDAAAVALAYAGDVCLVAYDGDTGARYTADAWVAPP
jgi:hypothetical protein